MVKRNQTKQKQTKELKQVSCAVKIRLCASRMSTSTFRPHARPTLPRLIIKNPFSNFQRVILSEIRNDETKATESMSPYTNINSPAQIEPALE